MSKRVYYRRYRRTYPKQKWMPVTNDIIIPQQLGLSGSSFVVRYQTITVNATRTTATGAGNVSSASIIKTGRFKYNGVIYTSNVISHIVGIAFIPEGYNLNADTVISNDQIGETFFYKHPEWILCWKRMDYSSSSTNNEITLSSRLKRNLNSGDGIVLFCISINYAQDSVAASRIQGTVSYVCRTN